MEKHAYSLLLTKLHCVTSTAESGCDDIFFEVYAGTARSGGGYDETFLGRYFDQNPLHMKGTGDDADAFIDISFNADDIGAQSYVDYVRVFLYDNDDKNGWNGSESGRDKIGETWIWRDDALSGTKTIDQGKQGYGKGEAEYQLSYRVIDKPIQTLRVFGIYCEESSKGCDVGAVEEVFAVAELAATEASEVLGKNPRPRSQAMSKAFEKAADCMEAIGKVVIWAINAAEGADEVYIQHVDKGNNDIQGGGWPTNGKPYKMHEDNSKGARQVMLGEGGTEYIRIPIDQYEEVTLQLREQDPMTKDNCIGSFTIKQSEYSKYEVEGGRIVTADDYFNAFENQDSGQGALYQLCISVGLENWAESATHDAQGS